MPTLSLEGLSIISQGGMDQLEDKIQFLEKQLAHAQNTGAPVY